MNASTVSWHIETALLPGGWASNVRITVSAGRIAAIEPDTIRHAADVPIAVAMPGMPNLHSHAFQRAMAGLTEIRGPSTDSFWTWRDIMYRFVGALTPDMVRAIAAYAYMEMVEAGFVRVGEFHYLHHDPDGRPYADPAEMAVQIAAAARQADIGLTLLPVFYAHSGFGGATPKPGQARFLSTPESYGRLLDASRTAVRANGDAIVGIAPHSLRATTPTELRDILPMASGPVHIHIAEQLGEVTDCLAWSGARPIEWLLANAEVDRNWCLVHATHLTEAEAKAVVDSRAVVGLCPITEANLGDGIFPADSFLAQGGRIGIGSDSNVRIDLSEELRLLEYGQRLARRSRNLLASEATRSTARRMIDASLAGGHQALGGSSDHGAGLAIGASADLIVLDRDAVALRDRQGDAILDSWIFSAGQGLIRDIWRGGRRVVVDGRHVARDSIEQAYRATLARLLQ